MNKKKYLSPSVELMKCEAQTMLAVSTSNLDTENSDATGRDARQTVSENLFI